MCGFAAILAPFKFSPSMIRAMCRTVAHRGPDDEGYLLLSRDTASPAILGGPATPRACYDATMSYAPSRDDQAAEGFLALGHRRLSIVDLSPAGHQPMSYAGGDLWLVFNGEIYNFVELRQELSQLGHSFHTHTDTEIILAAYKEWGKSCLDRFNGMWAFVLFDRAAKTVFVARDRWGIKPLYYWISPAGFIAFASEIKQFTVLPGWCARLNGQRAYDFLNWRVTDHTDETLFEGVYQLRGGEHFEMGWRSLGNGASLPFTAGSRIPTIRWYQPKFAEFSGSFDDASDQLAELLTDSVRLRLRVDVPVGSCLSGGIDSSAIVCAMNSLLKLQGDGVQKTFSACSTDARFDERAYIDDLVRATKVDPHFVYPAMDDVFDSLDRVAWHQDEPFSTTSVYAQWSVFELARKNGVVVMLDGQGADEQLAGYHTFFAPLFAGLAVSLRFRTLLREIRATKRIHGYSELAALRQIAAMALPGGIQNLAVRVGGLTQLSPDWLDMERLGATPAEPFGARGARTTDVRSLSIAQLTSTNLQMLLHWEDRDSMAHSVEARVPFLDYRLVEFVLGLPSNFKISGGVTKRVLRQAMKGVLPESIRMRMDKMGFLTAEEAWVREIAPERFQAVLRDAIHTSGGVLRESATQKLERIVDGRERWDSFAWRLISFSAWMRTFGVTF